jgi:hypothetical protein
VSIVNWTASSAHASNCEADRAQGSCDAVVELTQSRDADDTTIGVRLLADVRVVFDDPEVVKVNDTAKGDGLTSGDLAAALA